MNRLLKLSTCRALRELQGQEPLTDEEYDRLEKMAEICPLEGEHFDEVSWLYPLRIPLQPKVHLLDEGTHVISISVQYNRRSYIGLIGDEELETHCLQNPGGLIFAVGEMTSRVKEGREYLNLRPRGWKIRPVGEIGDRGNKAKEKKK